jgi:hypothetical protein
VDPEAGLTDDLTYRISVEFGDGRSLLFDGIVRIPPAIRPSPVPTAFDLGQNYPNPFNAETRIPFAVDAASAGPVKVQIFDILGRRVATVFSSDNILPGRYECEWDGRDSHDKLMATGVYFYRIDTKGRRDSRKMLLLK